MSLLELAKKRGIQPGGLLQKAQQSGLQPMPSAFPTQEPEPIKQGFFKRLATSATSGLGTAIKQGVGDFYQGSIRPLGHAVDPFVKVAGSGVREIQSIPAFLRGDYAQSEEIAKRPMFGQKTLEGSTNLENLGSALEVGSNLLTGGSYKGIKEGVFQATKTGVKQGSALGLGTYLANEEDPTLGGAIKSTLTGGAMGGVASAGVSALMPLISGQKTLSQFARENLTRQGLKGKLQKKFTADLEQGYGELFGGTKSGNKKLVKSKVQGKDPAKILAENGYIVDTKKVNGRHQINAQPTIEQIRTQEISPLETTLDELLTAKDRVLPTSQYISLDKIAAQAKRKAVSPQAKGSANLPKIFREIDATINDLRLTYGDEINLSQLNEIKKGQWSQVGTFDPTSPRYMGDVNRAIGQASRETIENAVDEVSIKNLNSKLGDWYDVIGNLNSVDGGVVRGGKIGTYVNRAIGAIIGTHLGGLPGGIAGDLAGGFVSDIVQSTTITNPMKRAILESIPKNTSIYTEAQQALQKLKYGQTLLPEGRGSTVQSNVPIRLPARPQSTVDAAEIANVRSTRVVQPKGTSEKRPITQVFGGASNVKKSVVQTIKDKYKNSSLGKEDGFMKNPFYKEAKQIDNLTKKEMVEVIDYVRLKKPYNQKIEDNMGFLAEKYGITDKTPSGLANKLQDLVEKTKTVNVSKSDPLVSEAKKYKSAEEFVKAQPKLYHAGTADIKEVNLNKSSYSKTFYLSENPEYAKSFGGKSSQLNEIVVNPEAKLADMRKPSEELVSQIDQMTRGRTTGKTQNITRPDGTMLGLPEVVDRPNFGSFSQEKVIQGIREGKAHFAELPAIKKVLQKLGYDGQITSEVPYAKNIGVWNKEVIKTKSQLTDIWNKANKKSNAK